MLSVEINTRLVKLYWQWPEREKYRLKEGEAFEFFKWLFVNFHEDRHVQALDDVTQVEEFLVRNRRILTESQEVKTRKTSNARIEPRISNEVDVVLYAAPDEAATELATQVVSPEHKGVTIDVGLHGLQVAMHKAVPFGEQLGLQVTAPDGTEFKLTAETRWSRLADTGQLLGLRILEGDGFAQWQQAFGRSFVAPRIGRNYRRPNGKPD